MLAFVTVIWSEFQERGVSGLDTRARLLLPRGLTRVDKKSPIPIGRSGESPALVSPQYIIEPRQEGHGWGPESETGGTERDI
jgi:hypothetical protein